MQALEGRVPSADEGRARVPCWLLLRSFFVSRETVSCPTLRQHAPWLMPGCGGGGRPRRRWPSAKPGYVCVPPGSTDSPSVHVKRHRLQASLRYSRRVTVLRKARRRDARPTDVRRNGGGHSWSTKRRPIPGGWVHTHTGVTLPRSGRWPSTAIGVRAELLEHSPSRSSPRHRACAVRLHAARTPTSLAGSCGRRTVASNRPA
jgi:hypothetical protein